MVDEDDPTSYEKKFRSEKKRLRQSNLPDDTKQKINRFITDKLAGGIEKSSAEQYMADLRRTAQRTEEPLPELSKEEYNAFINRQKVVRDFSPRTINHYKTTLSAFAGWCGLDWSDEVEFETVDDIKLREEKLFSDEEVSAMIEEAGVREAAAIAMMADGGFRIGALCSFRTGDLDLSGEVAVISFNEQAPVKGAEGTVPLTWSRGHVVNYLEDHPRRGEDDAPLFVRLREDKHGVHSAVGTDQIRYRLKGIAEDVGIESERMKPHNFRHTAITNWVQMGLSERMIRHRAGWASGSDMLDVYTQLSDDDLNEMIADELGLVEPSEEQGLDPESRTRECSVCHAEHKHDVRYCPGCGNPARQDAATDAGPGDTQAPEKTAEDLAEIEGVLEEMDAGSILQALLEADPELIHAIKDTVSGGDDDDDDDHPGTASAVISGR